MNFLLELKDGWNEQFRPFATVKHHSFEDEDLTGFFAHGTFAFILKCQRMGALAYGNKEYFRWTNYAPFIGNDLLNSDYSILPAIEMKRLKYQILARHAIDCKMFIRPNDGNKLFTGQIMDITEIEYFSNLFEKNLVVLSKPQDILGEWRFIVKRDTSILGVSLYRYQDNLVSVPSCPPAMRDYVAGVASRIKEWPDDLMSMDVAQMKDMSFKIIECNSFSTCGLYAMQPEPIMEYIENL
jgi:hypothetical protein